MAEKVQRLISLDSSVLIEHFRKSKKEKPFLFNLARKDFDGFIVSVIVHYEIYKGATAEQMLHWNNVFEDLISVPYTLQINLEGLQIHNQLKRIRKSIQIQDLIIAATSKSLKIPLATINEKHFDNIEGLDLITPSSFLQ